MYIEENDFLYQLLSIALLANSFETYKRYKKINIIARPFSWKRRPGRQKTLHLSYIQKLLGDTDNMLQPNAIWTLAQNRGEWRKYVIACCEAER